MREGLCLHWVKLRWLAHGLFDGHLALRALCVHLLCHFSHRCMNLFRQVVVEQFKQLLKFLDLSELVVESLRMLLLLFHDVVAPGELLVALLFNVDDLYLAGFLRDYLVVPQDHLRGLRVTLLELNH